MSRRPGGHRRGFTLIEMTVTLAVCALALLAAAPSLTGFQRSSALASVTHGFVALLATTRGEAIKHSATAMVVPLDASHWASGWRAFVDRDFNGRYDPEHDVLIAQRQEALPPWLAMSRNTTAVAITYNSAGYSVGSGGLGASTLTIARTDLSGAPQLAQTRLIKISATGRVRVCTPLPTAASPCD